MFNSSSSPFHRIVPLTPFERLIRRTLRKLPHGVPFCGLLTLDMEVYEEFARRCRESRCRPPSLYAYFARCLGAVLQEQREILAIREGNWSVIPERVDICLLVEMTCEDDSLMPIETIISDAGVKSLEQISQTITLRVRHFKRNRLKASRIQFGNCGRFAPRWTPYWWREAMSQLREMLPSGRRRRAMRRSLVRLSSTTQWLRGSNAWAVQSFTSCALSVTLGGLSRRPVVVGEGADERIEAHWCLDVALHFDHMNVDGAPATRFGQALRLEVESGRLLEEFPLVPRARRRSSQEEESDS